MSRSDAMLKLDLSGLKCPQPVLHLKRAAKAMKPGEQIEAVCTDPLAIIDIPHYASQAGHKIIEQTASAEKITFLIELGSSAT